MYAIDNDFDKAGYMNPLPTADDEEPDDNSKRSAAAERVVAICCSGYPQMPLNPPTLCSLSSPSSTLTFVLMANFHHHPFLPSPCPILCAPPLYHLLAPEIIGAANAASTSPNLSLSRKNPISTALNPCAACYLN